MSTGPLVSVIIPAFNAERFLADAVGSVLRQTWTRVEVIIVDDGSTDRTAEVAERLAAADERVRIVRKENGGPSSARNSGVAIARGEFVCFLDADDLYLPDKIERQLAFLALFPSCDLVFSDQYVGDGEATPVQLECKRPPPIPMRELLVYVNWLRPMSPLIRARLVEKVGAWDESLRGGEDWDYWIRCSRCGVFSYLPGPVGVYRTHPDQATRTLRRMRSDQDRVIAKHFERGSIEWRITLATRAWGEARRSWVQGHPLVTAGLLARCVWLARSHRTLRNVLGVTRKW